MPVVNPLARELVFKIVYYGPGLGGKTTTLQHIHSATRPEHRGKMVSLATPVDRTLYFDFLPIRVPNVRGMNVRLQLFTVPGQVYYNATRKLVLTGADGVVFVADSQRARADANLESLDNLVDNLVEHGRSLPDVPHVLCYNKRDLEEITPVEELEARLNRHGARSFSTVAARGEGVFESLEAIARGVLAEFERRIPDKREEAVAALALPEGGLAEALRESASPPTSSPVAADPAVAKSAPPGEAPASTRPGTPAARGGARSPSGTFRFTELSDEEEDDVSRMLVAPARAGAAPAADALAQPAPGFAPLFPAAEGATVRELEAALARGEHETAVLLAEQLVARTLASAAVLGGTADAPRDPSTVALLLGLDGRRYLEFRALVRDCRSGRAVAGIEALTAWSFALEARVALNRFG